MSITNIARTFIKNIVQLDFEIGIDGFRRTENNQITSGMIDAMQIEQTNDVIANLTRAFGTLIWMIVVMSVFAASSQQHLLETGVTRPLNEGECVSQ